MPDAPVPASALNALLGTELSVLQAAASATISEASTRSLIYLSTLSSGLVSVGFAADSPALLSTLTFTVLPTIFMLGWFTVVRLVDNTVENITVRRRMERIREYFVTLDPRAPALIALDDPDTGELGIRYSRSSFLFTMASMVAAANAVLAGALLALALVNAVGMPAPVAQAAGAVIGIGLLTATFIYERRRIRRAAAG